MSLAFPAKVEGQASPEAIDNLRKLSEVDSRGRQDQVVTKVALECFRRNQELQPGYFDGITSWLKAGAVYTVSAAAVIAAIGSLAYVVGPAVWNSKYGITAFSALGLTYVGASELGFEPLRNMGTVLVLAVRDAANRAANWSVKSDLRTLQERQNEARECHQMIVNQLSAVYNDSAMKLREMLSDAIKTRNPNRLLESHQVASQLEERLPLIKKFLHQLQLENFEIESILQEFTGAIHWVHSQSCQLQPHREAMNAGLVATCPESLLGEIAVPANIKERISHATQSRLSQMERLKGYCESAWSGVKWLTGYCGALAVAGGGYLVHQKGLSETVQLITQGDIVPGSGVMKIVLAGMGVLAFAVPMIRQASYHQSTVQLNSQYVETEMAHCKNDLRTIYDGIADYLTMLPSAAGHSMAKQLEERMPLIHQAIQKQGIDPTKITQLLEAAIKQATTQKFKAPTRVALIPLSNNAGT